MAFLLDSQSSPKLPLFAEQPDEYPSMPMILLPQKVVGLCELEAQRRKVREKMSKKLRKLETLQANVKKLQSEHESLQLKEQNIRAILERVAIEVEDDLECAKKRKEALKQKLHKISISMKVVSECSQHFDLVYQYWRENQL